MLEFDDGIRFNLAGKPRIESRWDGLYVVGDFYLVPVDSRREAELVLKEAISLWETVNGSGSGGR